MKEFRCVICKMLISDTLEHKYLPFCSKRCQQIDLGAWASESYKIPVADRDNQNEKSIDLEEYDSGEPESE